MMKYDNVIILDGPYLVLRSFFGALNNPEGVNLVSYAWTLIINKIFSLMQKFQTKKIFIVLEGRRHLIEKFKI